MNSIIWAVLIHLSLILDKLPHASATVFTVIAGDTADLINILTLVKSADTVRIPPGTYNLNGNLQSLVTQNQVSFDTDLIIRGEGVKPSNTKLLGLRLGDCPGYLVFDNLAIYGSNATDDFSSTIDADEDDGIIFRNSLLYTNNNANPGIQIYSERIGFINTNITNLVSFPSSSAYAYNDEANGLVMLNSKISGYDVALNLDSYYWTQNPARDYKVR